ncbi:hypothetical protein SLS62_005831 [Diatrype stigma]|uniref:Uncharacterized protein n=1 Tax=Diatrype stigma TaxID=117547 RepID=A0AAN9UP60_9PEZI
MPVTSKPIDCNHCCSCCHNHVYNADEIQITLNIILQYLIKFGCTERILLEARKCLWDSFIQLMNHLGTEAGKDPEFYSDFKFLKRGFDHASIAFRHMWSWVLDFVKKSNLAGDPLEEMVAGIVTVGKSILQMSPSGGVYFSGLIDLENQAHRAKANTPLKVFFDRWDKRTADRVFE